jgi:hypothetical protein
MAGHWCPYCRINKETRQAANHTKAELWSLAKLQDHLDHLEALPKRPTAQEKQGVVCQPLLSRVPLRNLVPPVLHMELGLINLIIDYTERWVHVLFDPAPSVEVEAARLTRLDCLRRREQAEEAVEAFHADCRLLSLLSQIEDLQEALNEGEEEELLQLQAEELELQGAVDEAERALASAKARETKLSKTFGRLTWPTVLRIEEEIYLAWSIRRPSYHGGDFVGPACRLIMRLAETLLGAIADLLLSIPATDRSSGVSDDDIHHFTAAITRLLQYGDAIFAIARKGEREVAQADRIACAKYIPRFCRVWRLLRLPATIKFHILEDHLLDNLGNVERLEDSTEQQHQISHSFEMRNRIADYKKKVQVASRLEAIRNNPAVQQEKARVLQATRRVKRKDACDERIEIETKRRRGARLQLLEMDEVNFVPRVDSILLEQLQAYADQRDEDNA